jgi:tripartite-type tricarboxylate transporter receptor subunit TctC
MKSEPALTSGFWLFTAAKTPAPLVERLSAEFARAMRSPRLQALAKENSLEVAALTPAETSALLKEDRANAARIFKTLGIKPEDAPN